MIADFVQTGLSSWWAPALAFAAGVISFASPCVFPLVPGYLSFVAGTQEVEEHEELEAGDVSAVDTPGDTRVATPSRRVKRTTVPVLLFIAGFSVVFTLLGAFTKVFVPILHSETGLRIAGLVILVFGVVMILYALRKGSASLYAERRPFLARVKPGPAGAFPLGMAFAAGWTPCLGPVLSGLLAIAAAQGGAARGAWLLLWYSMGLGVPFLLIGLGMGKLVRSLEWVQRHYRAIAGVSGGIMAAIGLLLILGQWQRVMGPILEWGTRVFNPPI